MNWGPMRLTYLTGRHRSTIWKVLARHGQSRRRRSATRQTSRRYEWTEAGALLHIDGFELPKFGVPGHWATGQRAEIHKTRRAGKTVVISVIDDHTRLAYCELHSSENAIAVSATLRRAASWFPRAGLRPHPSGHVRQRQVLRDEHRVPRHARPARRPPDRHPALHTTLERQDRALLRHPRHRMGPRPHLANSTLRDRALSSFIRFYNRRRPHSAANGQPPISRVH
jgi:hypothetical protein